MLQIFRRRRRWWLVLLASGIVVLAGLFWRTPLSPAERELVGVWQAAKTKHRGSLTMELAADRRFRWIAASAQSSRIGFWRVEGDALLIELVPRGLSPFQRMRLHVNRLLLHFRTPPSQWELPMTVRRLSPDSLETNRGLSFTSVRWHREGSEPQSTAASTSPEPESRPSP